MTSHRINHLTIILAAAIMAAACGDANPPAEDSGRERNLDRAFAAVEGDPALAADLFAEVGPGSSLEHARMAAWADCLERTEAGVDVWRRYLDDRPPDRLAAKARLALMRALGEQGQIADLLAERQLLPTDLQPKADEILLEADDPAIRMAAARRLAISAPPALEAADRDLARRLLDDLDSVERLQRADAWRRAGQPSRGASELRRQRWDGEIEARRRRGLARAELASGSPVRALRALPSGRGAEVEDFILRAQASRNRAWNLFPGRGESRFFSDCLTAAESVIDAGAEGSDRLTALALRLECATQNNRLDTALESWSLLEAEHWADSKREWLGRRLGVALAVAGRRSDVHRMARSLPAHQRCLLYWASTALEDPRAELEALATARFSDLYGQWSRQSLGQPDPEGVTLAQQVPAGDPPRTVQRLLEAGTTSEAVRQWRRIRGLRTTTPEEALAAAELAAAHGAPTDAIRWLRAGFPELGTIGMADAPENAVRAYLPLRWPDALAAAAREFDLDPWLLAAIARQESGFAAHAVSPRGAIGVLQLLPSTGRLHARALGLASPPNLRDPALNLRLGARELSFLMRRFGAVEPALAAYNGGFARVRGWWRRWPDRQRFTDEIPVPETYNYVRRVVWLSEAYRLVYSEDWRNTS